MGLERVDPGTVAPDHLRLKSLYTPSLHHPSGEGVQMERHVL